MKHLHVLRKPRCQYVLTVWNSGYLRQTSLLPVGEQPQIEFGVNGRSFYEECNAPIVGTTGIPLRTKTSSILPAMARFEPYISAVVRGRLRSLSCLATDSQSILSVGPDNPSRSCAVCVPCTIPSPYATDESRRTCEENRVGEDNHKLRSLCRQPTLVPRNRRYSSSTKMVRRNHCGQ